MKNSILIIDDDPVVHHILSACLSQLGFAAEIAASGEVGISTLKKLLESGAAPEAIFLDVMLGDMHGSEVYQLIRQIEAAAAVPVIVLSANAERETKELYPTLNASHYLQKPFVAAAVRDALESVGVSMK